MWGYEKGIAYLLLGIGFTACASNVCTERACNAYLVLSMDAGDAASGEVRIAYDGVDVKCEHGSANNPCWIGFKPDYRPDWVPSGAVLLTSDTPTEITITLIGADGEERTKTIRPSYEVKEPNGPGCGTCSAASEVVSI
jgi:hypothetical protein